MTTTTSKMDLTDTIQFVKNAPNMVQVEFALNSITEHYLNEYAGKLEKAPVADNYGSQSKWIEKAVRFFIANIHADKLAVWGEIPVRFHNTNIYQRLKLSQFVKGFTINCNITAKAITK